MTTTGEFGEMVPQDVAAIFHVSFHTTQGYRIDWSMKDRESMDITGVEYSCLPSGLHTVDQDVIYFTKDEHQGVCIFRRRATPENGQRGHRFSSLGILLAESPRPRPWRHVPSLKKLVDVIYTSLNNREVLGPSAIDWDPARAFFEKRKVQPDLAGASNWNGWFDELDRNNPLTLETSPTLHLPHLLRILGPSALIAYKHALGRRRVLVYTAPPVEAACVLCQVVADICYEDQYEPTSHDSSVSSDQQQGLLEKLKKKSKGGIKVLGMVTLNDMDKLREENRTGCGWVACTTDRIILEKPSLYDLVVDLTTVAPPGKVARPAMYVSKQAGQPGSRSHSYKLAPVRSTWSDTQLWAELDKLLGSDSSASSFREPVTPELCSRVPLETVCTLCASLRSSLLHTATSQEPCDNHSDGGGAVCLEGKDDLAPCSEPSYPYLHLVGVGIEGRPRADPSTGRQLPHSGEISSVGAWADEEIAGGFRSPPATSAGDIQRDMETAAPHIADHRERRLMVTLSVLHMLHKVTVALLQRLASFLPPPEGASGSKPLTKPVMLTPKDVKSFSLGPLSSLDQRFVEWLVEEYGGSVRLSSRRKWRDLMVAIILGLV